MNLLQLKETEGKINACASAGCNYTCCHFGQDNYIVLYPGELQAAQSQGLETSHLEVSPLSFGGHRAICNAKSTSTCDGGYTPLDCRSYPYFPTIESDGQIEAGLKGDKCPLTLSQSRGHRDWVIQQWQLLRSKLPKLGDWISQVVLVGYSKQRTTTESTR